MISGFDIVGSYSTKIIQNIARYVLSNPILHQVAINSFSPLYSKKNHNYLVAHIRYLPGVTDNLAKTALEGIKDLLHHKFDPQTNVYTETIYLIDAKSINKKTFTQFVSDCYNPVIQTCQIRTYPFSKKPNNKQKHFPYEPSLLETPLCETINLDLSPKGLQTLSTKRHLSLSLIEMQCIQKHYLSKGILKERKKRNLPPQPTDVELEALAQTWSEHCKHKIFNATIDYKKTNKTQIIRSLYKTYIQGTTKRLLSSRKDVLSVFSDNAGVFQFDNKHAICVKVETHNSPSAIEPYGGAMTGIVGVNRDILGTGMGAKPIFNTDVFCFDSPFIKKPRLQGVIHPLKMLQEVHRGIRDGGNQSGIPTVNGSIVFHKNFLGRPLVFLWIRRHHAA